LQVPAKIYNFATDYSEYGIKEIYTKIHQPEETC